MAKNEPLCVGHVAFRLSDGTAYRVSSLNFQRLLNGNAEEVSDICVNGGMNPCRDGLGNPTRSCETCNYNFCLDGMLDGVDGRFAHVDCPGNLIPEEMCDCSKKTDLGTKTDIAVPFIEVKTGIVFQAIQGACVFYKTAIDVLMQRCNESFVRVRDFQYKPILDFKKGEARPSDYLVARVEPDCPGVLGRIKRGIYHIFHSRAS